MNVGAEIAKQMRDYDFGDPRRFDGGVVSVRGYAAEIAGQMSGVVYSDDAADISDGAIRRAVWTIHKLLLTEDMPGRYRFVARVRWEWKR